ncbi:hypothetical protein IP92_00606 [Pseudoduganella flava]|uniref:Glycosyl hydrolase n=1 Tax=Pseudoduganella flava TaxID=871742 RepID=A0A562Q4D7_9BURK|nr:glycosyl hydrolase [Pseudoduganella flava]QGZ41629.1 glycosyl hydrolase [Pseudoduganella flava]TWI51619.1 hypothetical protein IP92_00606 [Pseudoduganella flava]
MRRFIAATLAASLATAAFAATPAAAPFVASPYKHLTQHRPEAGNVITVNPEGKPMPWLALPGRTAALTWAFANGECGDELWDGRPGQAVADANVAAFAKAGAGYIVSTGGQGGVFTCASDAGMERFVQRYLSPQLLGFDFDIEENQTPAQIASLARRVAAVQKKYPRLRFSFTIATHAASDGSRRSLNTTGEAVLQALRASNVRDYLLNLMVMDYGPTAPGVCVVKEGHCDMAASALQAARNVHEKYGVPYAQIELTPMIGINDVVENVFTPADGEALARAVREQGMAGLHWWSVDRDTPCTRPVTGADAQCHTMPGVPAGAFGRAMGKAAAR